MRVQGRRGRVAAGVLCLAGGLLAGALPAAVPVPVLPGGPEARVPIEVETEARVRVTRERADGTQVHEFREADDIAQGEVVYYTLRVRNPGDRAAHDVIVTKPVPANTTYLAGSATGPGATVTLSIDGGLTFEPPERLVIDDAEGGRRPAPPERYTHIRWQLRHPLAPGAVAFVRFRAVFR